MDNINRFRCTWCDGDRFGALNKMTITKCLSCGFKYQLKTEQDYRTEKDRIFVKKIVSCPKDSVVPFTTVRRFTTIIVPKIVERKILVGKPRRIWVPLGK